MRLPIGSLSDGYEGDKAWVSFLDLPRVLHLYFKSETDRIGYEFFGDNEEKLCGLATIADSKEAIRFLFSGQSLLGFLRSRSLELYEDET